MKIRMLHNWRTRLSFSIKVYAVLLLLSTFAAGRLSASQVLPVIQQQTKKQISGTVADVNGQPIIGANVVEKGTTNGTVTDLAGKFTIHVNSDARLQISYIGYVAQEISTAGKTSLNIIMQGDAKSLEDVVVIGYGAQRKSDVTGAITSVKEDDLASRSVENVQQALQGKAAGVQVMGGSSAPGTSPAVRIRGISSNSSGNSEPLYIVDGLRVKDIAYLDPNNIKSMEILKDGASAAIYGVEAGNGVVLITTKGGTQGEGAIFYNVNYGNTSLARKPKLMNAQQYVDYNKAAGNSLVNDWDGVTDTDWSEALYGDGGTFQRHTLGFEGGNDKGSLYSAVSYMKNDGMYYGDKDYINRLSFQLNATYNIKPWLEFSSNNTIENSDYSRVGDGINKQGYNSAYYYDPLTPLFFDKDNLPQYMKDLIAARGDDMFMKNENGDYAAVPRYNADNTNPMTWYYSQDSEHKDFNLRGATSLNFKPVAGFVFTSRVGYRLGSEDYRYYGSPVYFSISPRAKLYYETETVTDRFYEWENFANFNRTFDRHNVYAMAGMSYSSGWRNYTRGSTDEFTNGAPNFHYLDYSASGANDGVGGSVSRNKKMSYFGRIGYAYNDRYMVQANFRADAFDASKLSKDNRWGYFPSVSAGWTMSNEAFMEDISPGILSYLKVRASYGVNGNVNVLNGYLYATYLNLPGYYPIGGGLVNTISPSSVLANPTLNWEESKQTDVGIDARFLNDRLAFTLDYYNKNTTGQLVQITPPLSTGTTQMWKNVGKVNNSGFEFDVDWQDKIADFTYGIRANLATLHNKVTQLNEVQKPIEDSYSNGFVYFYKDQPVWSYYGYEYLGPDPETGQAIYKDQDGNDEINEADKVFLGSAIPKFHYGVTLSAAYKGFDFTAFGSGSSGGEMVVSVRGSATANQLAEFWTDSWDVKGADAKYPHPTPTDDKFARSSAQLMNASYFKIKQLQLGYTIPAQLMQKIKITRLRIFTSLDNFFTFSKYPGMDPESVSVTPPNTKGNISSTGAMGMDYGDYPSPKTMTFGLNLSF